MMRATQFSATRLTEFSPGGDVFGAGVAGQIVVTTAGDGKSDSWSDVIHGGPCPAMKRLLILQWFQKSSGPNGFYVPSSN